VLDATLKEALLKDIPDVATDTTVPEPYRRALLSRMHAMGDSKLSIRCSDSGKWDLKELRKSCFDWNPEMAQKMRQLRETVLRS
jgi:hypothetical protein